jgi:hypothetical protein
MWRLLLRILITVVVTLAVIYVAVTWIAPVAVSYYLARKALPVARVVPTELQDKSVSEAPGKKLSYFGYEFEVPWSDLDETQTKLYPTNEPKKNRVVFHFRSGLRLLFTALPPREWANVLAETFHSTPQNIERAFGTEAMESDYSFKKTLYEFTPDKMHHWSGSQGVRYREGFLLIIKSVAPSRQAATGIFNVRNQSYKGFQEGDPQVRQGVILVDLFSDEGSVEMLFIQKDYQKGIVVTQPEINRIIRSLRKAPQE